MQEQESTLVREIEYCRSELQAVEARARDAEDAATRLLQVTPKHPACSLLL